MHVGMLFPQKLNTGLACFAVSSPFYTVKTRFRTLLIQQIEFSLDEEVRQPIRLARPRTHDLVNTLDQTVSYLFHVSGRMK